MPSITIFIPAENMPSDAALSDLTDQCAELSTSVLQAAPDNVHVNFVAVRHGRGRPASAQVLYRLEPFRTPPVMERFMARLDDAIRRSTRLTARIRCFGFAAPGIFARN